MQCVIEAEDFDFIYDCGIHQPLHTIKKAKNECLVSAVAKHYSVISCKAELDQILEGLDTMQVLDLIRGNPSIMRQLLVYMTPKKITADYILRLFSEKYSPVGSNTHEEAATMKWINFIQNVEGMYQWSMQ